MHGNRLHPKVGIASPPPGQSAGQLRAYPAITLGELPPGLRGQGCQQVITRSGASRRRASSTAASNTTPSSGDSSASTTIHLA